jgi:hypothetical protein
VGSFIVVRVGFSVCGFFWARVGQPGELTGLPGYKLLRSDLRFFEGTGSEVWALRFLRITEVRSPRARLDCR